MPDAAEVPRLITAIHTGASVAEVWTLLCAIMLRYGFDRINYSHTRRLIDPERASRSERLYLSSHDDPRVEQAYLGSALDASPMRRWAAENIGAISWRERDRLMDEYGWSDRKARLARLLDELGLKAGYTIGFAGGIRSEKGAMGLCAQAGLGQDWVDALWHREGPRIEALAHAANARITSLPLPMGDAQLTNLQRQIIGWLADGKTVQDTALLVGRSVSTVEKQLRLIREALLVETTVQAVAKLAFLNQLTLSRED